MPNPTTNFRDSFGTDLGNRLITKEYLMTVYPQIANQLITPELWTWGLNLYGQLGDNTTINRCTPVTTVAGGANWKQVSSNGSGTSASGTEFMAAIKTDGTLWSWGDGSSGQLGNNATTTRSTPVTTFAGGTNWKQISCGAGPSNTDAYMGAIKTDGTLWMWGFNASGQLGDNTTTNRQTPVTTFAGGTNWKQISCGGVGQTAAIKTDGTLWVWGRNYRSTLGLGPTDTATQKNTPVTTFAGGTNWKQVSSGGSVMGAIKTDGTLWVWGRNNSSGLGANYSSGSVSTPITTFAGGTNWKQVSAGYRTQNFAIKTDGTLWNLIGTPTQMSGGGTNWKQVYASNGFTNVGQPIAAIKTDGTLWVWGDNSFGSLGTGDQTDRNTPVTTLSGGTNWKSVCVGRLSMAAIKTSDDLQGI